MRVLTCVSTQTEIVFMNSLKMVGLEHLCGMSADSSSFTLALLVFFLLGAGGGMEEESKRKAAAIQLTVS